MRPFGRELSDHVAPPFSVRQIREVVPLEDEIEVLAIQNCVVGQLNALVLTALTVGAVEP
jgi:hypothetical protein